MISGFRCVRSCGVLFTRERLCNAVAAGSLLLAATFSNERAQHAAQSSPSFHLLQAFFTDTYIQEHPGDRERIGVLKQLIALQVKFIKNPCFPSLFRQTPVLYLCPPSLPTDPAPGRWDSPPRGEGDGAAEALTQSFGHLLPRTPGESGEAVRRHNLGGLPAENSISCSGVPTFAIGPVAFLSNTSYSKDSVHYFSTGP